MRILQVNCRYREYGGEQRIVENEAVMLRVAGHEVRVFEATNDGGAVGTVASLATSSWNPTQAFRLRKYLRNWNPDVAHVHNLWFSLSPSVVALLRRESIPTVMTVHNYRLICASANLWREGRPCRECVGRRFAGPGVKHGCYKNSKLLTTAVASASTIQTRLLKGLPPGHVIVPSEFLKSILVEGGLPGDLFSVMPWTTPDPGERANPPSESRDIYFVGRLDPETKGIERLVEGWNLSRAAGHLEGLRLNLVGTGPLEGSEAIKGRDIHLLGRLDRSDVDRHLLAGRALVMPSSSEETFGLAAIEAFAAGLPVVGSDRGALRETIGTLGKACVFDAFGTRDLSNALLALESDEWVDRMGGRARERFEASYSQTRGLMRLEDLYRSAVAPSARSGIDH